MRRFKVILHENESGGFTVTVPNLPGCVTQGKDQEEALARVKEAIEGFLEALEIEGLPRPDWDEISHMEPDDIPLSEEEERQMRNITEFVSLEDVVNKETSTIDDAIGGSHEYHK